MLKLIFPLLLFASCMSIRTLDVESERQEIVKLEQLQRSYHFTKNARAFTDLFSDTFISINRGVVSTPSREESFETFDQYFNNVDFVKWDDIEAPVIRFSRDASVAYVTVQKQVIVNVVHGDAGMISDTSNFAWLTVYKKTGGDWKIDCVASTNK